MRTAGGDRSRAGRTPPGDAGPGLRRLARNREASLVLREGKRQIARLVAEGDFGGAQRKLDALASGPSGDPRARIRPTADAQPLVRPVFVCGLHRSGTTLLVDHLKAHFDLAWLQNIRVPEGEGQFVQDVYPQEKPFGGPGSFAFSPQMRLRPVADDATARRQADRLAACWGGFAAGGARLLEKSPSNITRIGYLRSLFPDARFIVWMRDPRAVSLATRKWSRRSDLSTLMQHWSTAYLAAFEDLADDCIIARYEDFCADPAGELERIARFCDLDRRATPLASQDRFEEIRNSNAKYLAEFPPQAQRIPGMAAWELYGYDLGGGAVAGGGEPDEGLPAGGDRAADATGAELAPGQKHKRRPDQAGGADAPRKRRRPQDNAEAPSVTSESPAARRQASDA